METISEYIIALVKSSYYNLPTWYIYIHFYIIFVGIVKWYSDSATLFTEITT